jgi:serine/threonine protein kinase
MIAAHDVTPVLTLDGQRRLIVGEEIGRGPQGAVYVGRLESRSEGLTSEPLRGVGSQASLMRTVAVKVMDPALFHDTETMAELVRAVRRLALVRHPNVVQVTDYFVASQCPCIVQDLVDGLSLAAFVARGARARRRLPLDLALFIACEIAEGLSGARAAANVDGTVLNLVHHNLTPRQVLLSWHGEVKVGDFGWRPSAGMISGIRRTHGDVHAHVSYLAPEVARGARGDGRSDVFSLGVILHEMLYGPRFTREQSAREVLDLVRDGVVTRPLIAPHVPAAISAIVERACDLDARVRQPHAGVLAYDLRREALALGVGDGRMFLRSALFEMAEGVDGHDTV